MPQKSTATKQSSKFEDSATLLTEPDLSKTLVEEEDERSTTQDFDKKDESVKGTSKEKRPIKEVDIGISTDLVVMNACVVHSAEQEKILAGASARVSRVRPSIEYISAHLSLLERSKGGRSEDGSGGASQ